MHACLSSSASCLLNCESFAWMLRRADSSLWMPSFSLRRPASSLALVSVPLQEQQNPEAKHQQPTVLPALLAIIVRHTQCM